MSEAREFCAHRLGEVTGRGAGARRYIQDATLVTSELVTNAIKAGCAHLVVGIDVHHSHVRISVEDDGYGEPEVQHPPPSQGHGRGLQIVEQLSQTWGVSPAPTGKQVWAEMALPSQLTASLGCELQGPE